ncbi:metallopeptidase family protein [Patescibacteria group bacterium]
MKISKDQFEKLVEEALDILPEKIKKSLNNVAIFVEDFPTKQQLKSLGVSRDHTLFGLFEGHAQARKLNFGPVLPDRITIFRQAICKYSNSQEEIRQRVINTVKHEIAHHFGANEEKARRAAKLKAAKDEIHR